MTATFEPDTPHSPSEWEMVERFGLDRPDKGVLHLEDVLPVLPVGWSWFLDRTADIVMVWIRTPEDRVAHSACLVIGPGLREALALAAATAVWRVQVWWPIESMLTRFAGWLDYHLETLRRGPRRLREHFAARRATLTRRYEALETEMTGRFDWRGEKVTEPVPQPSAEALAAAGQLTLADASEIVTQATQTFGLIGPGPGIVP